MRASGCTFVELHGQRVIKTLHPTVSVRARSLSFLSFLYVFICSFGEFFFSFSFHFFLCTYIYIYVRRQLCMLHGSRAQYISTMLSCSFSSFYSFDPFCATAAAVVRSRARGCSKIRLPMTVTIYIHTRII